MSSDGVFKPADTSQMLTEPPKPATVVGGGTIKDPTDNQSSHSSDEMDLEWALNSTLSEDSFPLTKFLLYPKLSPELQAMIIKFALPRAGVVEVTHLAPRDAVGKVPFTFRLNDTDVKEVAKRRAIALMSVSYEVNKIYKKALPICLPMGVYRDKKNKAGEVVKVIYTPHEAPNFLRISADDLLYFRSYLCWNANHMDSVQLRLKNQQWTANITHIGVYFGILKGFDGPFEHYMHHAMKNLFVSFPNLQEIRVLDSPLHTSTLALIPVTKYTPRSRANCFEYKDLNFPAPKRGDNAELNRTGRGRAKEENLFKKLEDIQAKWKTDPYFLWKKKPIPRITYL